MYRELKEIFEKVKGVYSNCCLTIIMNTHRTKPDIQKDVILLKNMVKHLEDQLLHKYDKRIADKMLQRVRQLEAGIDHGHNLDSLILFVNDQIAEVVKLSAEVRDRAILSNTFVIRDLVRALNQFTTYYVLALSKDKARVIEAINDKEVREVNNAIVNDNFFLKNEEAVSMPHKIDQLIEEFYKKVDKNLMSVWNEKPLPVVICTEDRNYHHYLKITGNKSMIIGHLNESMLSEKTGNIINAVWPIVNQWKQAENSRRIEALYKAMDTGTYLSDVSEIWTAVNEGRGRTLFVHTGYFQPAGKINNSIKISYDQNIHENVVDDIVDEIIKVNLKLGGDVVFLSENELQNFQGLALTTRF